MQEHIKAITIINVCQLEVYTKRQEVAIGALFVFLPLLVLYNAQTHNAQISPISLVILFISMGTGFFLLEKSRYKHRANFSEEQIRIQWDKQKGKCKKCHNTLKEHAFHRHHKDGNRSNIKSSNLELLCANCHSEETYRRMRRRKKWFW